MSKIKEAFKDGKLFIPFITCGDPDIETTEKIIYSAVENGAKLIELGIPFSDPTAEGPVIQSANVRALKNGVTTDKIFDMVKNIRKNTDVALVFMTYANVIFSYGAEKFLKNCSEAGIDGVEIPDLPFEEKEEFLAEFKKYGIKLISIVSPNSGKRASMIAKEAEGFIYIAGATVEMGDMLSLLEEIRKYTDIPCVVDFDIMVHTKKDKIPAEFDGVIVSTPIIELIEKYKTDSPEYIGEYIKR